MKKTWKIVILAASCAVVLAMAATVSLSVMTYLKVNALEKTQPQSTEAPQPSAEPEEPLSIKGEDDIAIGGEYWIRSTKAISDAYLSSDSSALSEKDKETLEMASAVLDEIITDSMSDYEKEQAVFLWMHDNIGFDQDVTVLVRDDVSTDNPHGVLSGRSAVCVGYATTFRLFMQMLDIPCRVVHDTSLVHSWDLVQIDGHWYHVDLYSAQNEKEPLQYLNRSDAMQMALGSDWDTAFYPAADSLERCYVYQSAEKCADVYTIPAVLKKAIEEHSPFLSLILPSDDHTQELAEELLYTLELSLMGSEEYQMISLMHAAVPTDDGLFVYIKVDDYSETESDDDDPSLSYEEQERIDKAIRDAFGELTDIAYDFEYDFAE